MKSIQKSKGYSLIELLLVITIAATVVLLGFIGYSFQQRTVDVEKEVFDLNQLVSCAYNYAKPAISFQTTAINDLYNTNCFPDEVKKNFSTGTGVWTQAWGSVTFDVETVTASTNPGDLIAFTYPLVPSYDCSLFVTSMLAGSYDITINGSLAELQKSGGTLYSQPNMSKIIPLCTANTTASIKLRFFKLQSGFVTNGKYTSYTGFGFQPGLPEYDTPLGTVNPGSTTAIIEADNANAEAQRNSAQAALP